MPIERPPEEFRRYGVCEYTFSIAAASSFVGFDPDTGLDVTVAINSSEAAPSPLLTIEVVGAITGRDVDPPPDASAPPAAAP